MFRKWFGKNERYTLSDTLDPECLPKHVAIIMDGNGRWAKSQGLPRIIGHQKGVETVKTIVRYSSDIGLEYLTLYAFSTENWGRPQDEVDGLMELLVRFLRAEMDELHANQVRMLVLGDCSRLPQAARLEIESAIERTSANTGLTLCIALNYGSRNEITQAVKSIAEEVRRGTLDPDAVDEKCIESHLYTSAIPDPDLMIRTSGEYRISNFLLWQIAYSEFWFAEVNWPEFTPDELDRALLDYQNRNRRFGKV